MIAAGGITIFGPIYMIPIFFQFTRNDIALKADVHLLPFNMLMIFAVIGNHAILSTYGYYMPCGLLCITRGALMYTMDTEILVARVYGYSIIITFGDGPFAQLLADIDQTVAGERRVSGAQILGKCWWF